jgi:hypothetical protein
MASAELSRRVEKVVGYPPPSEMDHGQRREFHEVLLDADSFEDLPGKWRAAILKADRTGRSCGLSSATKGRRVPVGPARGQTRARSSVRSRGLSPLRSPCRIRTIWRRPPHGQAGIVSVRVGTALQVSFPHAWQMCSATAGMLRELPEPAEAVPHLRESCVLRTRNSCNLRVPCIPRAASGRVGRRARTRLSRGGR